MTCLMLVNLICHELMFNWMILKLYKVFPYQAIYGFKIIMVSCLIVTLIDEFHNVYEEFL